MKTFKKTHLPDTVNYDGSVLTFDAPNTGIAHFRKDYTVKSVCNTLKAKGKKVCVVSVLSDNLKNKTDLHGNKYQPLKYIFTDEK